MLEITGEGSESEFPKPQTSSLMLQSACVASLNLDKNKLVLGVVGFVSLFVLN